MNKSHDAMGQLLWDHYHGQDVVEIVEREDGYVDAGRMGPGLYFADYKHWLDCEKKAIKYARGRVLDIGCGGGRVGLYLQDKGHDVLGIEGR
jgi:2-polyprenyl-3-methyl-5-hydroxy-6-metoxy-1,4-benzoquinol methylase